MACTCSPCLIVLRDQVNRAWPHRDKASDGCCGDADHAARRSDHNPYNGYAHAYDFDEDFTVGMGEKPLWHFGLSLLADRRTKYLIYEGKLLYPDGRILTYTGINAHKSHLHLSVHLWATHDRTPWRFSFFGPIPAQADQEIDDMTNEQFSAMMAELVRIRDNTQRQDNRLSNLERCVGIGPDGKPSVLKVRQG